MVVFLVAKEWLFNFVGRTDSDKVIVFDDKSECCGTGLRWQEIAVSNFLKFLFSFLHSAFFDPKYLMREKVLEKFVISFF